VELEQAFIEHRINDRLTGKAGLMLMPVGILNETHEPDTFFGVERNPVEKNILPTTWWEAGLALSYQVTDRLSTDFMLSSGLNVPTTGSKAFLIRSGRQGVAKATANDGAMTARVRFQPVNGLRLSATAHYQQDITQGQLGVNALLLEADAQYRKGPFGLKALVARWDLDDKVNLLAPGREQQSGYYVEPSWRFGERQNVATGCIPRWFSNLTTRTSPGPRTTTDLTWVQRPRQPFQKSFTPFWPQPLARGLPRPGDCG